MSTHIDTELAKRGKTYFVKHAIETPNGSLHSHIKDFPKLFDDPAYVPRLIRLFADERKCTEAEVGRPVIVALVRVDQPK
jgi:hypothetical protein